MACPGNVLLRIFTSPPPNQNQSKPLGIIPISRKNQWHRNTSHEHRKDELNSVWAVRNSGTDVPVSAVVNCRKRDRGETSRPKQSWETFESQWMGLNLILFLKQKKKIILRPFEISIVTGYLVMSKSCYIWVWQLVVLFKEGCYF